MSLSLMQKPQKMDVGGGDTALPSSSPELVAKSPVLSPEEEGIEIDEIGAIFSKKFMGLLYVQEGPILHDKSKLLCYGIGKAGDLVAVALDCVTKVQRDFVEENCYAGCAIRLVSPTTKSNKGNGAESSDALLVEDPTSSPFSSLVLLSLCDNNGPTTVKAVLHNDTRLEMTKPFRLSTQAASRFQVDMWSVNIALEFREMVYKMIRDFFDKELQEDKSSPTETLDNACVAPEPGEAETIEVEQILDQLEAQAMRTVTAPVPKGKKKRKAMDEDDYVYEDEEDDEFDLNHKNLQNLGRKKKQRKVDSNGTTSQNPPQTKQSKPLKSFPSGFTSIASMLQHHMTPGLTARKANSLDKNRMIANAKVSSEQSVNEGAQMVGKMQKNSALRDILQQFKF